SANVPVGTRVLERMGNTVTMTANATGTATGTGATFKFSTPPSITNNAIIWALRGHRIIFGEATSGAAYLTINSDGYFDMGGGQFIAPLMRLPASVPTLTLSRQLTMAYVNDTTVRFYLRGADGATRSSDMTFA